MNTPAKNLSFYESDAAFDQFHRYASYYQRAQWALVELVQAQPGQLVVEIGCATGETSRALARRYPEAAILGVDFRPEIVAEASRLSPPETYPNLQFTASDMAMIGNYLPWQERYPDVLCSLYSFHHVPDPVANKYTFAGRLADLPTAALRVVIVDVVTDQPADSPAYPQAVRAQWSQIAQEAYRSVYLNRYIALIHQGVSPAEATEQAAIAAAYARDVELTIGETVTTRNDEYPVTEQEVLDIWLQAGFHVDFHGRVNAAVDHAFVFRKGQTP